MSETPTSYPLSWPIGRARTKPSARKNAAFHSKIETRSSYNPDFSYKAKKSISLAVARERLQEELSLLRAVRPVLSTNVELRVDGQPYSNRPEPEDPGAAVYFTLRGKPIVFACDTYKTVGDNVVAIVKHIAAMRAMERYGVGTLEQMFAGYTALPPGGSSMAVSDWRTELGDPSSLAEAEKNYHALARLHHPDVGGSLAKMAAINAAIDLARKYYNG